MSYGRKILLNTGALGVLGLALAFSAPSYAIDTEVQFSTTGNGNYDVTNITSFDWNDDASLVIDQTIVSSDVVGATTLNEFFAAANVGDTVVFNAYAEARLVNFTNSDPTNVPTLDTDGTQNGDQGFEVTGALSITQTAEVIGFFNGTPTIAFTDATGNYAFYYDSSPNSNLATGGGFVDGVEFLSGNVVGISGLFNPTLNGQSTLINTIESYDSNYIEADPISNRPLTGSTFNTELNLVFSDVQTRINIGGVTGLAPQYTVAGDDLILRADANTQFSSTPQQIPEPATLLLLGSGLLGLGMMRKKLV